MRKMVSLLMLLLLPGLAWADMSKLNVATEDGTVSTFPYKVKVTNGKLTDNGDGTASISISGGVASTRLINTTAPLTGGGDLSADRTFAIPAATSLANGYLTSADWTTFNGKQAAGNYITALTGDVTATGPGSVAATIASQTSTYWRGKVSDPTGTGSWVFGTTPTFTTSIVCPLIKPPSDSTTAFQITKADGTTNVLSVNTTNSRLELGGVADSTIPSGFKVVASHATDAYFGAAVGPKTCWIELNSTFGVIDAYNWSTATGLTLNLGSTSPSVVLNPSQSACARATAAGLLFKNFKEVGFTDVAGTEGAFQLFCDNATGTYAGPSGFAIYNYADSATSSLCITTGGRTGIGRNVTAPGAQLEIDPFAATTKGLLIKAAASASANLTEWQNSSAGVLSSVDKTGILTLGLAASQTGTVKFNGTTSGTVTLLPAAAAGTWTLTLPTSAGSANQVLQTDGTGVTTWAAAGTGTVTSVSVVTANGLSGTVANPTTTPALTLKIGTSPTTADALADVIWGSSATTQIPLILQGKLNQTAPLFKTENSAGTTLDGIYPDGAVEIGATGTTPGKFRLSRKGGTALASTDIVLSAAWGAGATVAVTGNDSRGQITVTTSAADAPTIGPTLTLTFKDGTWTTAPFAVTVIDSNSTGNVFNVAAMVATTPTTLVITLGAIPTGASALTYIFDYIVEG